jgi:preprotein translocase subunit SecG
MAILLNILLVIFVIVTLLMILVILMQRPKSEGLGAAFGGGVTENIFGAQTTNVLSKFTSYLAAIFFLLTFLMSVLYAHQTNSSSNLRQQLMKTDGAAAAPTPAPGPSTAVGAPGTVTNPAPGPAGASPAGPVTPADQAVGDTASGVAPPASSGPAAAEAQPTQQPHP